MIEPFLAAQRYSLKDVIKLTVFLVGDPKLGGKQDFKGFSEVYAQFFGTDAPPNKVARSIVQASRLSWSRSRRWRRRSGERAAPVLTVQQYQTAYEKASLVAARPFA
ncbi:hypothetical protein [Sphingobium bisphenolivorans]|uniref:hypothetical protein n=1 Tax=Sphingobium bisphenolivorans TaxID=1335760 RepID=UPI0003A5E056|nr:hypothetical protein [Sphingobium bisphenolivorans]